MTSSVAVADVKFIDRGPTPAPRLLSVRGVQLAANGSTRALAATAQSGSCCPPPVAKRGFVRSGFCGVADLRFEPPTGRLKVPLHTALWQLATGEDKRPFMSSLAEAHHSDKGKIYCVP